MNGLLHAITGPVAGQKFPLDGRPLIIGRDPDCHIVLEDPTVSHRHVRLACQGIQLIVEDLGSKNKTKVNGKPIFKTRVLRSGDLVQIGDSRFHLEFEEDDPFEFELLEDEASVVEDTADSTLTDRPEGEADHDTGGFSRDR